MPDEVPSADETAKVMEALNVLMKHPEIIDKLVSARVGEIKARENYSKLSNAPYYRERFARELQLTLDDMRKDGKSRMFFYADYPERSRHSLYLYVRQARQYLLDHLDPELTYRRFTERITVTREKHGVQLTLLSEAPTATTARVISGDERLDTWKYKVDKYLADAGYDDEPLEIKQLALTEEEVAGLKESMQNLPNIIFLVTPTLIKIKKVELNKTLTESE